MEQQKKSIHVRHVENQRCGGGGAWPDFKAYCHLDVPTPLCVEFKCGTRKLIDVKEKVLEECYAVKDRYESGYFSQSDECRKDQLFQERSASEDNCVRRFLEENRQYAEKAKRMTFMGYPVGEMDLSKEDLYTLIGHLLEQNERMR